jgi:hypothetical protein
VTPTDHTVYPGAFVVTRTSTLTIRNGATEIGHVAATYKPNAYASRCPIRPNGWSRARSRSHIRLCFTLARPPSTGAKRGRFGAVSTNGQ